MRSGQDITAEFPGLFLIHHNKPLQKTSRHSHDEHHLIIPLRGEFRLSAKGADYSVGPGRMIYVPANLEHEFLATNSKEGERLICLIQPQLWKRLGAATFPTLETPANQLCKELLFYLLLNPTSALAKGLTLTFATVLSEALSTATNLKMTSTVEHMMGRAVDERVCRAVDFLSTHFQDSDLKVGQISKAAGLSPRNLNRLFVEELGLGPKELLIRLRLEEARRLLAANRLSVTEASLQVGYGSLSRFIQAYRESFGYLPSEEKVSGNKG